MLKILFFTINVWSSTSEQPMDSLRMETIDGKSFIIHQIDEKETLYGVSRRYNVSITQILEFNEEADAGLDVGQILKIPFLPKSSAQNSVAIHTVVAGETLFSVSQLYGLTIDELKSLNGIEENVISVGQQLKVKKGTILISTPTQAKSVVGFHTVKAKETLYSISKDYGITIQQLKEWNDLIGSNLDIGQLLRIAEPGDLVTTPTEESKEVEVFPKVEGVEENVVKISENVAGTDEVKESGLSELIEGTEGSRKYLALHRTAKTGTILKVRNELNNREVFVRVVGKLPNTSVNNNLIIKISRSAFDRLGGIDTKFRVEVTYYK